MGISDASVTAEQPRVNSKNTEHPQRSRRTYLFGALETKLLNRSTQLEDTPGYLELFLRHIQKL